MVTSGLSRIGIDARLISYREGGIAEYTRRLIEALGRLETPNPSADYVLLEGRHAQPGTRLPLPANFHYRRAQTPCHHRLERSALALETLPLRLDVLHSPDFIPPRFGARHHVITVHDLTFLHYPQYQTPDSVRYYAGQIRAAIAKADHILVDSDSTRLDLINLLNAPPEKLTTHRLGVDPAFRPLPAAETRAFLDRRGLPQGYILHVGTVEPRKNLPGLFSAYHLLRVRFPDAPPLVIAGRRGWLTESIYAAAESSGEQARIVWLEDVPFADMPALYNGAGVLVMPSFYEGFGFPPLEAMACGTPTVVSDRSSLPEVVGDVGLRIDPDQPEAIGGALYLALTDSQKRSVWREAGLQRAALFTWDDTARAVRAVYQELLRGERTASTP